MMLIKSLSCFVVSLIGIVVICGWVFGWEGVKSVRPEWVTMKVLTALCFIMAGPLTYLMRSNGIGERSQILGSAMVFGILSLVGSSAAGAFLHVSTGVERLFINETNIVPIDRETVFLGQPALGTVIAFFAIGLAGIMWIFNKRTWIRWMYGVVLAVASVKLVGYALNIPQLYHWAAENFNPMAFHTAALLALLGWCGIDRITITGKH